MNFSNLDDRLRVWLAYRRKSPSDLARGINVTTASVNNWLSKRAFPRAAQADAMLAFLDVTVDKFYGPTPDEAAEAWRRERGNTP